MEIKSITEESGVHKEWMHRAKKIKTSSELKEFVDELRENYNHDYGTICHAIAAAAIAAAWAVARGPQGGITGFQAGAIMWEMIKGWGVWSDGPLQIVQWGQLKWPQYDSKLPRFIAPDTLQIVQEQARETLKKDNMKSAHPDVLGRLTLLAEGGCPNWLTVKED